MPLNHSSAYSQLTDEHFKSIGKVVVEWSNIEYLLGLLLCSLLFTNEFLGRGFTDQMNASQILSAIDDSLKIHEHRYQCSIVDKETMSVIKKIKKEIENLRSTRNKISHLCWMRSNDEEIFGTSFSIKLPQDEKGSRKSSMKISLKELDEYYQKSHAIVEDLQAIVYCALPPLNDARIQKMLNFENSGLSAKGLEDMVRYRFHHRIYQDYLKPKKKKKSDN